MAGRVEVVRLSSKGQIVIPARMRRVLGIERGQSLRMRLEGDRQIVLSAADAEPAEVEAGRAKLERWVADTGRDPVGELHARRRRERTRDRERSGR